MSVTDAEELTIRRQADEIVKRVLAGSVPFDFASPRLQASIEGREFVPAEESANEDAAAPTQGAKRQPKKRNLAEKRRAQVEAFFRKLGLMIEVPKPNVSNREFNRRRKAGQELFFRPATSAVSYEAFMTAVGQGENWTVTDEDKRDKIGWEGAEDGYWFWVETAKDCPRLGTSRNSLTKNIRLLSLEEYVIVWHFHKALTGEMLDIRTWCWLRTRFGRGALRADGYGGRVNVRRCGAERLSCSYAGEGGRSAEVVN